MAKQDDDKNPDKDKERDAKLPSQPVPDAAGVAAETQAAEELGEFMDSEESEGLSAAEKEQREAVIADVIQRTVDELKWMLTDGGNLKATHDLKSPDKTFRVEDIIFAAIEKRLGDQGIILEREIVGRGRAPSVGRDEVGEVFRRTCGEIGKVPLDEQSEAQIKEAISQMLTVGTVKQISESAWRNDYQNRFAYQSPKEILIKQFWRITSEAEKSLQTGRPKHFNYDNLNINSSRVYELTREACAKMAEELGDSYKFQINYKVD
jgi:hypothetical protein